MKPLELLATELLVFGELREQTEPKRTPLVVEREQRIQADAQQAAEPLKMLPHPEAGPYCCSRWAGVPPLAQQDAAHYSVCVAVPPLQRIRESDWEQR